MTKRKKTDESTTTEIIASGAEPSSSGVSAKGFYTLFFLLLLTWGAIGTGVGYVYFLSNGNIDSVLKRITSAGDAETSIDALTERVITLEQEIAQLEGQSAQPIVDESDDASAEDTPQDTESTTMDTSTTSPEPMTDSEPSEGTTTEQQPEQENSSYYSDTDKESLQAGLEDVNNRMVSLEEHLYQLKDNLHKAKEGEALTAMIIAVVNLRDAIAKNQPFSQELEIVRSLAAPYPNIQQDVSALSGYALSGMPSDKALQDHFYALEDRAVTTARKLKANPSTLEKLATRFSSLISVRKTSADATDHSTEATIARTEQFVKHGDFDSALREISLLDAPEVKAIFQPWTTQAKDRQQIRNLTNKLFNTVSALGQTAHTTDTNSTKG